MSCLVCTSWRDLIQTNQFWRSKLIFQSGRSLPSSLLHNQTLTWKILASICVNNGYARNLLVNGCGQDVGEEELANQDSRKVVDGFTEPWPEYPGWNILSSGGSGWRLHRCIGEAPQEFEANSCFLTSYHSCSKVQVIDLAKCGVLDEVMDKFQPVIKVKDWYSKFEGHGAVYEVKVELLDDEGRVMEGKSFSWRDDMEEGDGTHWRRVEHEWREYGPGVRSVRFYHGGTDTAMKEGWWGSKMSGSSIVVDYPTEIKTSL